MSKETTYVGLTKPDAEEYVDIDVINSNYDKIDNELNTVKGRVTTLEGKATSVSVTAKGSGTIEIAQITVDGVTTSIKQQDNNSVTSVAGKTGAVTLAKGDVGLGNVTNVATESTITQNSTKNITSGAVYTALAGKQPTGNYALKSELPTVNNGQLTIQKNGTQVATFTANQSGNSTANITVPTALSDLSSDATHRLVTDTEKSTWNAKQDAIPANTYAPYNANGYLPLSGGTLSGSLIINATGNSYNEGIRIKKSSNNWATFMLGTNGATTGMDGGWLFSHKGADGTFLISKKDSNYTTALLYGKYANNKHTLTVPHVLSVGENASVGGNLTVTGNLYVQGDQKVIIAEKVESESDYIVMRKGATTGLAAGVYSGFEFVKYDGTNNGRLVVDSTGTARVGDITQEQALLTRSDNPDSDALSGTQRLLGWDTDESKAVACYTVRQDSVGHTGWADTDAKKHELISGYTLSFWDGSYYSSGATNLAWARTQGYDDTTANHIATIGWMRNATGTFAGDKTWTGTQTFAQAVISSAQTDLLTLKNGTANGTAKLIYVNSDGLWNGTVEGEISTAGIRSMRLGTYSPKSDKWDYIGINGNPSSAPTAFTTHAPTPATGDNSTQIATTAFVKAQNYITGISVTDASPTLAWGTKSKVATVAGVDINVTMPANPNSNTTDYCGGTNNTGKLFLVGRNAQSTGTSYTNSGVHMTNGTLTATKFVGDGTGLTGIITCTEDSSADAALEDGGIASNNSVATAIANALAGIGQRYVWRGTTLTAGGNVTIDMHLEYIRNGPKKGVLNGSGVIYSTTATTSTLFSTNWLSGLFGLSFKAPASDYYSGVWMINGTWNVNDSPLSQVEAMGGATFSVRTDGRINPGRYYQLGSNIFGDWPETRLGGRTISFWNVYLEEN